MKVSGLVIQRAVCRHGVVAVSMVLVSMAPVYVVRGMIVFPSHDSMLTSGAGPV